ncbi:MAG: MFS transporter [Pseudarcicella sp.]|nr:MFS transporter [Pseudarcicella sp.]
MQNQPSPFVALKYPEFRAYIFANALFTMALLIQEVLLGYQIYKFTHDPLSLGLVGLAEAVPFISIALFGGYFADKNDKKTIMVFGLITIILCSFLLIAIMSSEGDFSTTKLSLIYGVIFTIGLSRGFFSPAASSLNPFLVPKEIFTNAATWASTFWQTGAIMGPALAGFIYLELGLVYSLYVVTGLLIIALFLVLLIKKRPLVVSAKPSLNIWQSLREGIAYVFSTKIILYSISLDLFSVLFGGVIAILPIFAADILKVGPAELGIMRAAPSIGAMLTMLAMVYFPPTRKAWRNLLMAIAGFGIATIVFAIASHWWISVVALFFTGAFDSVSVVIRQSVLRHFTPDEMRGRVSSVNSIFVSSSNELGAFESGLAAKLLGTVPSVLMGGSITLLIVTWVALKSKSLFKLKVE